MYIRNREFILPETEGMKRRIGKLGWRGPITKNVECIRLRKI